MNTNKYQEAFNNIVVEAELMAERCGHKLEKDIKLVQELVDKEIPSTPYIVKLDKGITFSKEVERKHCGVCCGYINGFMNYCPQCGNKIDRSKKK